MNIPVTACRRDRTILACLAAFSFAFLPGFLNAQQLSQSESADIVQSMARQEMKILSLRLTGDHRVTNYVVPAGGSSSEEAFVLKGKVTLRYLRKTGSLPHSCWDYGVITETRSVETGEISMSQVHFLTTPKVDAFLQVPLGQEPDEEPRVVGMAILDDPDRPGRVNVHRDVGPAAIALFSEYVTPYKKREGRREHGQVLLSFSDCDEPGRFHGVDVALNPWKSGVPYVVERVDFLDAKKRKFAVLFLDEWEEHSPGAFFPTEIRYQAIRSDRVVLEYLILVEELDLNPSLVESDFGLVIPKYASIWDRRHPTPITGRYEEDATLETLPALQKGQSPEAAKSIEDLNLALKKEAAASTTLETVQTSATAKSAAGDLPAPSVSGQERKGGRSLYLAAALLGCCMVAIGGTAWLRSRRRVK